MDIILVIGGVIFTVGNWLFTFEVLVPVLLVVIFFELSLKRSSHNEIQHIITQLNEIKFTSDEIRKELGTTNDILSDLNKDKHEDDDWRGLK